MNEYGFDDDPGMGSLGVVPDAYTGAAIVTTSDPAPTGDLKVHDVATAASIQVGTASKDATVQVLGPGYDGVSQVPVPGWVQIAFSGDGRNGPASGFVSAAYLTPVGGGAAPVQPSQPSQPNRPNTPPESGMSTVAKVGLVAAALAVAGGIYLYATR